MAPYSIPEVSGDTDNLVTVLTGLSQRADLLEPCREEFTDDTVHRCLSEFIDLLGSWGCSHLLPSSLVYFIPLSEVLAESVRALAKNCTILALSKSYQKWLCGFPVGNNLEFFRTFIFLLFLTSCVCSTCYPLAQSICKVGLCGSFDTSSTCLNQSKSPFSTMPLKLPVMSSLIHTANL